MLSQSEYFLLYSTLIYLNNLARCSVMLIVSELMLITTCFFLSNCETPTKSHLSKNACFVSQVRTTRNSVMHNADFTFTTAEMKTHLHCMTDLLREPNLHVLSLGTAAQDAIDEINQVRQ